MVNRCKRGQNLIMSLALPHEVARRLQHRQARNGPAASALFGRSVRLLEAADELERTAHEPTDEDALVESLGCLTAVFDGLSTATLQLGLVARARMNGRADDEHGTAGESEEARDAVTSMLFAASQNLRIAAETSKQAKRCLLGTQLARRP